MMVMLTMRVTPTMRLMSIVMRAAPRSRLDLHRASKNEGHANNETHAERLTPKMRVALTMRVVPRVRLAPSNNNEGCTKREAMTRA